MYSIIKYFLLVNYGYFHEKLAVQCRRYFLLH